jgi:hypothetical protein
MRRGRRVYQPDARYCRLYVSSVTPRGALRAQAVLSARTRTRFLSRDLARADEENAKAQEPPMISILTARERRQNRENKF